MSLTMWTVYERPSDFPDLYVARKWEVQQGFAKPTLEVRVSTDLSPLEDQLSHEGLTFMQREPSDEPQILGVWL